MTIEDIIKKADAQEQTPRYQCNCVRGRSGDAFCCECGKPKVAPPGKAYINVYITGTTSFSKVDIKELKEWINV